MAWAVTLVTQQSHQLRNGAEEKTRTSTSFRIHEPESCASTNSATSAYIFSLLAQARTRQDITTLVWGKFESRIIANSHGIKMPIHSRHKNSTTF